MINDLLLKEKPVIINTKFGQFVLKLNSKGELELDLPDNFKLNIKGDLNLILNGEFNVDASEVNIVSRGDDINLDSLDASIYLNSYRAKQIKDIPEYIKLRKEQESAKKNSKQEHRDHVTEIYELLGSVIKRLDALEEREKSVIDITKDDVDSRILDRAEKMKNSLKPK